VGSARAVTTGNFKKRQKLGKYRIEKRLAEGPYASVYAAMDTIEGQRVALKVPRAEHSDKASLEDFKREARLAARLYHPNILPLKDASFIDGRFVIVTPLGDETLATRLSRRVSMAMLIDFADQLLDALAYAHSERVLHCDVKPENLILFGRDNLMLADFGIAKTALRTIKASGSGTLGYLAPEQAMGRPSPRSDVFVYLATRGHREAAQQSVSGHGGIPASRAGREARQTVQRRAADAERFSGPQAAQSHCQRQAQSQNQRAGDQLARRARATVQEGVWPRARNPLFLRVV